MKNFRVILEEWDDWYQAKREYFSENEFEINEPTKHKALKALEEYILSCHNIQEEVVSDLEFLKSFIPFHANASYIKRYKQRQPRTDFVINLRKRELENGNVYFSAEIQYNRIYCFWEWNNEEEAVLSLSKQINDQHKTDTQCLKVFRDFIKNFPLNENAEYIINKRIKWSLREYQFFFDI